MLQGSRCRVSYLLLGRMLLLQSALDNSYLGNSSYSTIRRIVKDATLTLTLPILGRAENRRLFLFDQGGTHDIFGALFLRL